MAAKNESSQEEIGNENETDESSCDPKKRPSNVTECSVDELCPKWIISKWSNCIGQCGSKTGYRTRTVMCSLGTNRPNVCDVQNKPTSYENCTVSCSGRQWKTDDWSEVKKK